MKRSILVAAITAATLSVSALVLAQPGERHERKLERMTEELQLTETQQQQVQLIMEESRQQHHTVAEDTRAKMAQVLTPEQQAIMESHKHRGESGHKGMRGHCEKEAES
ncbi:hypothetical protein [Hahella ganghwensis]|uniref:hypothetical protein n=1 Tax=Hahella ganghwensis TaxID=286420 RepID=UPI000363B577|nr:hypothetical protein [Hahella ganghwensis]